MTRKEALRLEYLDGLRALAAIYVVLFHAGLGFLDEGRQLLGFARNLQRGLSFGHDAVAVFIVLSGYCLMLPVARAEGQLVRGLPNYIARRAWRILPPYFAALLASLLLIALIPVLETPTKTIWADTFPAFEFGPIASHVLLIHNLFPAFAHRINGPLWSVATEWQIYFFFPFVLLPVWRRFGMGATLALALGLSYAPLLFVRGQSMLAIPWYLLLFAQGMAAAQLNFGQTDPAATARRLRLFRQAAAWGWGFCLVVGFVAAPLWFRFKPVTDTLVGASTAALLVYATERVRAGGGRGRVVGFFESRPVMALGHASYSLYLTHLPIVALCYFAIRPLQLPLAGFLAALAVSGLVASLLFAAAFYWLIERHFVSK